MLKFVQRQLLVLLWVFVGAVGCTDSDLDLRDSSLLVDAGGDARETPAEDTFARDVQGADRQVNLMPDVSENDADVHDSVTPDVSENDADVYDSAPPDAARTDVGVDAGARSTPPRGVWGHVPPAGASPPAPPFALPAGPRTRPVMVVDDVGRVWSSGIALARRVAYDGGEVAPFLVVLDRDGRSLGQASSPGEVAVESLVADASGAFVAGTFRGAVSIADAPWDSAGRREGFVARYSPRGERQWASRLGAVVEPGGASLSRSDAGVALLLSFRGELRAGPRVLTAPADPRLARVDLSVTGSVLAALDLGAAVGSVVKGAAVRGGGTTLWTGALGGSHRLAAFRADGTERWSRTVTASSAVFDANGWTWLATCANVTAVDDGGGTRWSVALPPIPSLFFIEAHADSCEVLRHEDTLVVAGEANWNNPSGGPLLFCALDSGYFVAEYWLDTTGRVLVTPALPLSNPGLRRFGGMAVGAGRTCRLGSVDTMLANAFEPGVGWRLACDGLGTGGCNDDELCGGGCGDDILNDSASCGACGRSCGPDVDRTTATCLRGVCVARTCAPRSADCDRTPTNGCEVDLARSDGHCGACGNACPSGASCVDGRCCRGTSCADTVWVSDGSEGAFAPTRDTTLTAGIHRFTTVTVPAGVTVRTTAEGVLDLRATGDVRIDGTFDLRGGDGGAGSVASGGGTAGASAPTGTAPGARGSGPGGGGGARERDGAGAAPGLAGPNVTPSSLHPCVSTPWSPQCFDPGVERVGRVEYEGAVNVACEACLPGGRLCLAYRQVRSGGGSGGSIGVEAMRDLAVHSTLRPGSGGGASGTSGGAGGGGGGGALRISTPARITLGASAVLRADGGAGGAPDGGAGSGGVIVLAAPEMRVSTGAVVSARGGGARGGLGRVRVTADPSRCFLQGAFTPPLRAGCGATSTLGAAYIDRWPY